MFHQPVPNGDGFVGRDVVADDMHVEFGRDSIVDRDQKLLEFDSPFPTMKRTNDRAVGDIECRKQTSNTRSDVSMAALLRHAGSTDWERSSAYIPLFSSTHSTPRVRTIYGSDHRHRRTVDSWTIETIAQVCGVRSNLRQIRPILDFGGPGLLCHQRPRPMRRMRRQLLDRVRCDLFDLLEQDRLRAGGGSSVKPSSRSSTNRQRHLVTVLGSDLQVVGDMPVRRRRVPRTPTRSAPPCPLRQLLAFSFREIESVFQSARRRFVRRPGPSLVCPSARAIVGLSVSPGNHSSANRRRHAFTVIARQPRSVATWSYAATPSLRATMIRSRTATHDCSL